MASPRENDSTYRYIDILLDFQGQIEDALRIFQHFLGKEITVGATENMSKSAGGKERRNAFPRKFTDGNSI